MSLTQRIVQPVYGSCKLNLSLCRFSSSSSHGYAEYERKKFARRFGNIVRHHDKGLLPRLDRKEAGLKTIPVKPYTDPWHPKNALFGQNDFIDILGTGNTQPATLLKHIPWYLRGWKSNEMTMLQRQAAADPLMETSRPEKWKYLQNRINFLYKFKNRRSAPPKRIPKYF